MQQQCAVRRRLCLINQKVVFLLSSMLDIDKIMFLMKTIHLWANFVMEMLHSETLNEPNEFCIRLERERERNIKNKREREAMETCWKWRTEKRWWTEKKRGEMDKKEKKVHSKRREEKLEAETWRRQIAEKKKPWKERKSWVEERGMMGRGTEIIKRNVLSHKISSPEISYLHHFGSGFSF